MTEYWLVLRQDDNGNVFVMSEHASEAAARSEAATLEARAHEQIYWIERRSDQPPKNGLAVRTDHALGR